MTPTHLKHAETLAAVPFSETAIILRELLAERAELLDCCIRTKEILDAWGPGRRGHTLELLHGRLEKALGKAVPSEAEADHV